ncbi:MAG: hypothetical protein HKM93_12290 [Desulfobacteraceae bacterium]|nr:hypothetical protein [Desulfobacteraceae bacterium]
MKKNIFITGIVAVIVLGFVYFYFQEDHSNNEINDAPHKIEKIKKEKYTVTSSQKDLEKPIVANENSDDERKKKFISEAPAEIKGVIGLMESSIIDIEFYGKLIDQYNEPVSGASVKFSALSSYFGYKGGAGEVETDQNGLFEIRNIEGTALRIYDIMKEGYQVSLKIQDHLFYPKITAQQKRSFTECTISNPCIFKAWKYPDDHKSTDKLVNDSFIESLISNGTIYSVDLFAYGRNKVSTDPKRGQFRMFAFYEKGKDSWKFVIESDNTGLIQTKDLYTNEAPISNYTKHIEIKSTDDLLLTEDRNVIVNIYFNIIDKKMYGRLRLRMRPWINDSKVSIKGMYTINTTGKRSLDTYE